MSDDSINRLVRLVSVIPAFYEIIVVDDGSPMKVSHFLEKCTTQHPNGRYIRLDTRWCRFSLARSRNRGASAATTPVVIFHDVDFIGMPEVYHRIADVIELRQLAQRPQNFFCIPIGFLTADASLEFIKDLPTNTRLNFWSGELHGEHVSHYLQHFVKGSSCIALNRLDLLAIGGHDESYYGHGAEDFELLHRLTSLYPIAEKPLEYSLNTGSGLIKEYKGFRAYFALYGEDVLRQGISLVHLYHPKRKSWGYYQHSRNFTKLKKLMNSSANNQPQINTKNRKFYAKSIPKLAR